MSSFIQYTLPMVSDNHVMAYTIERSTSDSVWLTEFWVLRKLANRADGPLLNSFYHGLYITEMFFSSASPQLWVAPTDHICNGRQTRSHCKRLSPWNERVVFPTEAIFNLDRGKRNWFARRRKGEKSNRYWIQTYRHKQSCHVQEKRSFLHWYKRQHK